MQLCTAGVQWSVHTRLSVTPASRCLLLLKLRQGEGLELDSSPFLLLGCRRHSRAARVLLLEPVPFLVLAPRGTHAAHVPLLLLLVVRRLTWIP